MILPLLASFDLLFAKKIVVCVFDLSFGLLYLVGLVLALSSLRGRS
jgi:hypothetical protein